MKKSYGISIILLTVTGALFIGCKKASNSGYIKSDITFGISKYFIRDTVNADSMGYYVGANAYFEPYPDNAVGSVFVNGKALEGPIWDMHSDYQFRYFTQLGTEQQAHEFAVFNLKVNAPNGVTDLDFTVKAIPFYNHPVPYKLNIQSGFTLQMDNSIFPGDSLFIGIACYNQHLDTVITEVVPSVTLNPAMLSNISLPYPMDGTLSIYTIRHYAQTAKEKTFKITNGAGNSYDVMLYP